MKTKVSFIGLDRKLVDKDKSICFVPISVGQPYHEGYKFEKTLSMISDTFSKCIILVCDTLQRYSHTITSDDHSLKKANLLTEIEGQKWINRNLQYFEKMQIPYEIIRWNSLLKHEKFKTYNSLVLDMYNTDNEYNNSIHSAIEEYVSRLHKRNSEIDYKLSHELSLAYIKEECSAMSLCVFENKCEFVIYPTIIVPVAETLNRLKKTNQNFSMIGLRFKKHKSNSIHENKNNAIHGNFSLEYIMNHVPGHIYWKDVDSIYLGCNNEQAQSLGLSISKEIIGKTDFDLPWGSESAIKIIKNDQEVINSGKSQRVEELVRINDKDYIFLSQKSQLKDKNDKVIGMLGVSLDITKQKELEKRLVQQTKQLEENLSEKRRFLNNLSHEIRTPLHVIKSISDELYQNYKNFSMEETKGFLKVLVENNDRLMILLTNLLQMAKNKQNKERYNFKKVNLSQLIVGCINEVRKIKEISFEVSCDHCYINGDEIKFTQVIRNILDNAIKYGGNSPILVELDKPSQNIVILKIQDHGIGIPVNERKKVLEPFYQASNVRNGGGGTGLGLSICSEIIEAHKGDIWIEEHNQNTIIYVKVPCL